MTIMQEAFAKAEKMVTNTVPKEQRIWNIVKSKPWITLNEIVQRMGIARMDVTFTVTKMVDRGMLDKRSQRPPGPKMGRTPNEYKCVHDTYVLLPMPKKEKKVKVDNNNPTPTYAPTLPDVPQLSKTTLVIPTLGLPTLLDRVKAAPFGEVREIYAYLKEMFRD